MKIRRSGFTLIEMMVVILLLSLMMAVVVTSINKLQASNRRNESISRLKTLARALQMYRDDWGDVPPYNPMDLDFDGDGNADPHGPGLWALVMLDYLTNYSFLSDSASGVERPWVTDPGGGRLEVIPGDPVSMGNAFNLYCSAYGEPAIAGVGRELTQREEWIVYNLLARPSDHDAPSTPPTDFGPFTEYDDPSHENYCSWMMQDAYSLEWKYLPVRRTTPPGTSGDPFPVDDPTAVAGDPGRYYHRQLSHRWTDEDSPRYRPASDTVVTWSSLLRPVVRETYGSLDDWGTDLILYADGHVAAVAAPTATAADDPAQARAVLRPPVQ